MQGGMAWVANARLAAAVSNGGGLGIIAAATMPPELLEREIDLAMSLTDKPFGVNIMLLSEVVDEVIELVAEKRIPVVTTGAGMPGKVFKRLKPLGTVIIPVVAAVSHARRVCSQGADAVVAEGNEAGGHIGELNTMVLVPQIVESVDVPVIAAGGIATGRGMAAAFALGAEGVQVGTRFVCAEESTAHDNYKKAIIKASDRSTVVTGRAAGHPVRVIKNKLSKRYEELEKAGVSIEKITALGAGTLRRAVVDGDVDYGSIMAGQSAGMVRKPEPAADIIRDIVTEAEALAAGMKELFE